MPRLSRSTSYPRQSEKLPLLPVTTINGIPITWPTFQPIPPPQRSSKSAENILLTLSLLLSFLHVFILYFSSLIPEAVAPLLLPLGPGLRVSIPSALPTAVTFFIAAPFLASHERRNFTRCLAVFCYLCGSTIGGVMVGRDLSQRLVGN